MPDPRNPTDMWVAPLNVDLLRLALTEPANDGTNAVPPTDLNVPFREKDDAKRLGARWDAARKTWFLPDCTDTAPFEKWLPRKSDINLRCASYFIAQSVRACWHCDRSSHVFSFLLPPGYETRQDSDESASWEPKESEAIIYYITQIPEAVQIQMRSITSHAIAGLRHIVSTGADQLHTSTLRPGTFEKCLRLFVTTVIPWETRVRR
jgi:hypothetical protein